MTARDVGVGIASKDGSNVNGNNIAIKRYKLHAVMSYMKKDFYQLPAIDISNVSTTGQADAFFAQDGCRMIINGNPIKQEKIDVKELYQTETMGK